MFRVEGLKSRFYFSGLYTSGFRVQGSRFRFEGSGFRV